MLAKLSLHDSDRRVPRNTLGNMRNVVGQDVGQDNRPKTRRDIQKSVHKYVDVLALTRDLTGAAKGRRSQSLSVC
jgi:hypothetical protein